MKEKYHKHWFLLVFSIRLLCKNKVTSSDIKIEEKAIKEFVEDTERLYGKEHLSSNMHLLLHMPRYVKDWGALWCSSAFMYEHNNGILNKLFEGTRSVMTQIMEAYNLIHFLKELKGPSAFGPNSYPRACKLFKKLMGEFNYVQKHTKIDRTSLFGFPMLVQCDENTKVVIEIFLRQQIKTQALRHYRFVHRYSLYTSILTARASKRDDSHVIFKNGVCVQILDVLRVSTENTESEHFVLVGKELLRMDETLVKLQTLNIDCEKFLFRVNTTAGPKMCFTPDQIEMKFILHKFLSMCFNLKI